MLGQFINNFTVIESVYGKFVINRHCAYQAEYLIKTGRPHIEREIKNILEVANILPEGCVFVDVGANAGLVSIPVAQMIKNKNGTVCSFEPQRMIFYSLCGAAALNDLDNIFAFNMAVGRSPGSATIRKPDYGVPQDFGEVSLIDKVEAGHCEKVAMTSIDAQNFPRLDFLKIDVEGMELAVLSGAQSAIHEHQPWCWVEYFKSDIGNIIGQFGRADYRFFLMDPLNMLCAPIAKLAATTLSIDAKEV
jgi:FkbM family methyltransferase